MTRTGRVPRLMANAPEPVIELNAADAARLGIADGDLVRIESRFGGGRAKAVASGSQRRGEAFLPMHWSGRFAANAAAGSLSAPVTDPFSGQPELKHVPVRIAREPVAWAGVLMTRRDIRPTGFVHWSRAAVAGGWVYELSGTEPPEQGILLARRLVDVVPADQLLEYTDRWSSTFRAAATDGEGRLAEALLVAPHGHLPQRDWLLSLLASVEPLTALDRRALLSGRAPVPVPSVGRIVCSCFNVGVNQLTAAISGGSASLDDIGKVLKAGTNCGSCRSEIRTMLKASRLMAAE
jgi:assimilatory nitrate reductase catalytic subunit